ncbi:MAG: hypothetical protein ACOZEN_06025 [Thermodesulfobacteriota bacterium]
MTRSLTAALAVALVAAFMAVPGATPAQARLVKELQVVRSGKLALAEDGNVKVYKLLLEGNKLIVLGDRDFFPPATRAALDQAVEKKLTVDIAGHLLIFNDQAPVFTLPVGRVEVKGLDMATAQAAPETAPSAPEPAPEAAPETARPEDKPQAAGNPEPIKDSMLKFNPSSTVGRALDNYAFFSKREWRMLEPGRAEFRGTIDLSSITEQDSRYVARLRSRNLGDTFKSIEFAAVLTLRGAGIVESGEPAMEAVFADGTRDRLVWKDPPNYYWDRIYRNRKIKLDYFLSKASLSPKYGKGMGPSGE